MTGFPNTRLKIGAKTDARKAAMQHREAAKYVTQRLRKNAAIELCLAGCDDDMVKAVTGHSGAEMLMEYGGTIRRRELAARAREARDRLAQTRPGTWMFQRVSQSTYDQEVQSDASA